MTDLPLLNCVPEPAASLALQLHFITDFQLVLKKLARMLPQYTSTIFSLFQRECSCIAVLLLFPNHFT